MKKIAPIIVCILALSSIWVLNKYNSTTELNVLTVVKNPPKIEVKNPDTVFVDRVDTLVLYKTKYIQKWNYDNPNFIVQHDTIYKDTSIIKVDTFIHHIIPDIKAPLLKDTLVNTFTGRDSTDTYIMDWEIGVQGNLIYFEPTIRVFQTEKKCRFWDLFKRKK